MSAASPLKNKHLTLDHREVIVMCLNQGNSFRHIAQLIGKDPSTIAKEVKRHRIYQAGHRSDSTNKCRFRQACIRTQVCQSNCAKKLCTLCNLCNLFCSDFESDRCPIPLHPPYVCNACPKRPHCRQEKWLYRAETAHRNYRITLSETRKGISLSEMETNEIMEWLAPLVKANGQSLAHIYATHEDQMPISERSLYRYIDQGILPIRNIDLPHKVRYKARKKRIESPLMTVNRLDRTYVDYKAYCTEHPSASIVEMDTVEGKKGTSVLMTLLFRTSRLLLIYRIPTQTSDCIVSVLNHLEETLGFDTFTQLFEVLVTDNGKEFSDAEHIEINPSGSRRSHLFYCDPRHAEQKGELENAHRLIRRYFPKSKSFDAYPESLFSHMALHINNYRRRILHNHSPYQIARMQFGETPLKKLGFTELSPDRVILKLSKLIKD